MRVLVDTNVFLDYFLKREDFDSANEFFIKCSKFKNQICVTPTILRDIEYVASRFLHNKEQARRLRDLVYSICYKVIGISAYSTIEAMYSDIEDYEDALLAEAASEYLLDAIVTNNKKDFEKSIVPAFTPKELNAFYK